ncbi:MAG: BrnA antitoxin family protein [Alphaproteobacteria bacterium]|nr:BrnA antitoxin family protein [Alphaproteobacteria bacterium]
MRPMRELDPDFVAGFEQKKRKRGRPAGRNKAVVSISLDQDLLKQLRSSGSGWQSRVNALLRAAIGLHQ